MRTDSFDQTQTDKPEPSTTNAGGAEQTPPVEQARPQAAAGVHYGRQHAQTAALYRKHREAREARERAEQMRASEAPAERMSAEAAAPEVREQQAAGREEPLTQRKTEAENAQATAPDETRLEALKERAQQAVSRVMEAAKEAAKKSHPLTGARKLAGEAFSGVRRVARQVSARTGRSTQDTPK